MSEGQAILIQLRNPTVCETVGAYLRSSTPARSARSARSASPWWSGGTTRWPTVRTAPAPPLAARSSLSGVVGWGTFGHLAPVSAPAGMVSG
jgi:hypothetical protein